jgi:hypothetical protein
MSRPHEMSAGSQLVAEATQKLTDMLGSVKDSADLVLAISTASSRAPSPKSPRPSGRWTR